MQGSANGQPRKAARIAQPIPLPPLAALQAELERVLAANQARLTDMQRQGMGADPLSFVHARIDSLIDFIAQSTGPDGARWATLCRLTFEQKIAAELERAEPEGRKAILSQGAAFTPGMIAQLARETGLFRRT